MTHLKGTTKPDLSCSMCVYVCKIHMHIINLEKLLYVFDLQIYLIVYTILNYIFVSGNQFLSNYILSLVGKYGRNYIMYHV